MKTQFLAGTLLGGPAFGVLFGSLIGVPQKNNVYYGFMSKEVMDEFRLGTKSNISKVKNILIDRDLVEMREDGLYIGDPVFQMRSRRFCL